MTAKDMKIKSINLPLKTSHKDGDINLTKFFKKTGKQLSHYFDNKGKTLEDISEETKIPQEELIYRVKIKGRYNVWANKIFIILMDIEAWANKAKKDQIEEEIRERLKAALGGDKQATRIGQIDLLTKKEIIEIKVIDKWKEGVGQLILFGKLYPNHSKRLHLFGNFPTRIKPNLSTELLTLELIKEFCNDFNIKVILEGASQFCTFILNGSEPLVIWLLVGMILQNRDAPILEKELGINVSERNGIEDKDCMQLSLFE
ncbi:hypothetical protein [Allocoleopsis sp.]|uniref:hypothetical protein n=1 Tax=Allocoleopsis sp. TaxID=3088169 RepID=UPI002FD1CD6E